MYVIFLRIPRTAGKSVNKWLRECLGRSCYSQGHLIWGFHKRAEVGADWRYVTMVREPVDRAVSLFGFAQKKAFAGRQPRMDLDVYKRVRAGMTFEEFLVEDRGFNLGNCQTRVLAGADVGDGVENCNVTSWYSSRRVPEVGVEELERAKAHMMEGFACVGVFAHFKRSVKRFARVLPLGGVGFPGYHINPSRSRPRVEDLSRDVVDLIVEQNRLDVELYEFAVGLMAGWGKKKCG